MPKRKHQAPKPQQISVKLNKVTSTKPTYNISMPKVVSDAGIDSEYSSDEDLDIERRYEFPPEFFANPFQESFRLSRTAGHRGQIVRESVKDAKQSRDKPVHPSVDDLLEKIQVEGFSSPDNISAASRAGASSRVALHLGFNRMRSMQSRHQKKFTALTSYYPPSPLEVSVTSFLWDGRWQKYNPKTKKWTNCSYEEVRAFYLQLKRKEKKTANIFREKIEQAKLPKKKQELEDDESAAQGPSIKGRQVPYREIREEILKNQKTSSMVKKLRQSHEGPSYIAFFDSDTISFMAEDGKGIFHHYDRILAEHHKKFEKYPDVASTGYRLPDYLEQDGKTIDNRMNAFAAKEDLWTRHMMAQYFPDGVYYPEPNTIVKINDGQSSLEASFVEDKNYKSPQEMVILVEDIKDKRQIDPKDSMVFDATGAITTEAPARMQETYKAHYNKDDKIVSWSRYELRKAKRISQSHYNVFARAKNLLRAILKVKQREVTLKNGQIISLNIQQTSNAVTSILSRLFNHYDPVFIAERLWQKNPGIGFPRNIIYLLDNYVPDTNILMPVDPERHENLKMKELLEELDATKTVKSLLEWLAVFVGSDNADKALQATKAVQMKIHELLSTNLCKELPELSLSLLQDFFKELKIDASSLTLQSDLSVILFNSEEVSKSEKADNHIKKALKKIPMERILNRDYGFGTKLMHWAAITGNVTLIQALCAKDKPSTTEQTKKKLLETPAQNAMLPIHCGIKYCAVNGTQVELIQNLITPKSVIAQLSNNKTPLLMILTEIEEPLPLLLLLEQHPSVLPLEMWKMVKELAKKPFEIRENILVTLLTCFPKSPERHALFLELLSQGADCLQKSSINDLTSDMDKIISKYFDVETYETVPILEALAQGDVGLFKAILATGISLKDVEDSDNRTAVWIAIDCLGEDDAAKLLPLLEKHEADPNQKMLGETAPIHEVISPYNMPNNVKSHKLLKSLLQMKTIEIEETELEEKTPLAMAIRIGIDTQESGESRRRINKTIKILLKNRAEHEYLERDETEYMRGLGGKYAEYYNESEEEDNREEATEKDCSYMRKALFGRNVESEEEYDSENPDKMIEAFQEKTIAEQVVDVTYDLVYSPDELGFSSDEDAQDYESDDEATSESDEDHDSEDDASSSEEHESEDEDNVSYETEGSEEYIEESESTHEDMEIDRPKPSHPPVPQQLPSRANK